MNRKLKICKNCEKETYIFSKGECKPCASIRYAKKAESKRGASSEASNNKFDQGHQRIKQRSEKGQKTASEDTRFFKQIWKDRKHYSEVSGEYLGDEYNPVFFSHILTKKAYPRFRHNPDNIMLMTFEEHNTWEFTDPTKEEFKTKFREALRRKAKLIIEYYKK